VPDIDGHRTIVRNLRLHCGVDTVHTVRQVSFAALAFASAGGQPHWKEHPHQRITMRTGGRSGMLDGWST